MPNTTKTLLKEHQDISFIKKFATKLYNDNEKYKAEYSKNKTGTRDPRTTQCELVRNVIFIYVYIIYEYIILFSCAPTGSKRCVDPYPVHQMWIYWFLFDLGMISFLVPLYSFGPYIYNSLEETQALRKSIWLPFTPYYLKNFMAILIDGKISESNDQSVFSKQLK